jgi:uncharacterized protein
MLKMQLKTAITIQIAAAAALLMGQLTSPAVAANPSFSCSGSLQPVEAVICSNDALSALDRTLAADYKAKMGGLSSSQQAALERAEKAWLTQRNSCGPNVSCISNAYSVRISQLSATVPAALRLQACSPEGEFCKAPAGAVVWYGAVGASSSTDLKKTSPAGGLQCSNATFGGDPAPNIPKECYLNE